MMDFYKITPCNNLIGVALIFNHSAFNDPNFGSRTLGVKQDVDNLNSTFKSLGFKVHVYQNLTRNEVREKVQWWSENMQPTVSCLVVCAMSHGKFGGYILARDDWYSVRDLMKPFEKKTCSALQGKPKLFFIQACQDYVENIDNEKFSVEAPREDNYFIAYSSFPGTVSVRQEQGSWFIQELCKTLNDKGTTWTLTDIIHKVQFNVCSKQATTSPMWIASDASPFKFTSNFIKQSLFVVSTLWDDLIFPKISENL